MAAAQRSILCVDIGTSSIKGALVNQDGVIIDWDREYLLSGIWEDFENWDPRRWVDAFARLTARLQNRDKADALAISGNGPTLVPIDPDGNPLGNALMWIDKRARSIAGEKSFFLPKIKWLAEEQPELYESTSLFLPCSEYLAYVLTGEAAAVTPSTEFSPYLWTPEGVTRYGIEPEKLPPLVGTGELLGCIRKKKAEQFDLPENLPVYTSGSDFIMALLGTGTIRPGITCDRAGTSEGINHCTTAPVKSGRLRTLPHIVEGLYNVAGILSSTGRVFEWFRKMSGQERISYLDMLTQIASLPHKIDKPIFLPSLHIGPTWEFSGGAFMELQPSHGNREMGRAVVESIGFAIRDLIETMEEQGCRIPELRVSGGQARNPVWNQMKADITGRRVLVPEVIDSELLGSAACSLLGMGEFDSLISASDALVRFGDIFEPNPKEHEGFTDSYHDFVEISRRIVGVIPAYRRMASK